MRTVLPKVFSEIRQRVKLEATAKATSEMLPAIASEMAMTKSLKMKLKSIERYLEVENGR